MWFQLFVLGHVLAVGLTGGLAFYALGRQRDSHIRWAFAAMAGAFSVWSSGSLLRGFTAEVGPYLVATTVKYVGVGAAPVAFLLLALAYARREPAGGRASVAALAVLPALTVIAVATTAWHGLFYESFSQTVVGGVAMVETVRGPWFWTFALYGWGLLAVGSAILLVNAVQRFSIYRVHAALVVLGILVPWGASLAYILGGWPHPAVDPTPLAFALSTVLFGAAMFRVSRFELVTQGRGALFERSKDPAFVLDEEGDIVDRNDAAGELCAKLELEADDRLPEALAHEGRRDGTLTRVGDGEDRRVYRYRRTPLGDGEHGGAVVTLADVTEERRAREDVQERLAVERTILDATADGILVVDEEGAIVSYNERFLEIWNIPASLAARGEDEGLLAYVTDRLADPEGFLNRVQEHYDNPEMEAVDEIELVDGRVLERYGKPWRHDGEIQGRAWSFRDVTEQRRAERRFEELLEAAPDALVLVDGDGAIQLVNEQAENTFGYDREELLGEPVETLVPPRVRRDHGGHRQRYMADPERRGMGVNLDLRAMRKDGTEFPVEISLAPIENGTGIRVLSAVRDVTEHREIQRQVRQQAHELEETNDKLEQANEDLRSFARILSHDLKEPLRIVNAYTQLIDQRLADDRDDVSDAIDQVQQAAQRATSMIGGLRRFCQLDDGEGREDVDPGGVLEEITATLGMRIEETDATIEWGNLPQVHANRAQLGQLFQNLVENAIKFQRDEVPPRIEVTADEEGDAHVFCVTDNGRGIEPEDAESLFGMFDRGRAGTSVEGEGVGLAVCRKIVERHGGEIGALRNPEGGSTFRFTLPTERARSDPEDRQRRFDADRQCS